MTCGCTVPPGDPKDSMIARQDCLCQLREKALDELSWTPYADVRRCQEEGVEAALSVVEPFLAAQREQRDAAEARIAYLHQWGENARDWFPAAVGDGWDALSEAIGTAVWLHAEAAWQRDEARAEANVAIPDTECAQVALHAVKAMNELSAEVARLRAQSDTGQDESETLRDPVKMQDTTQDVIEQVAAVIDAHEWSRLGGTIGEQYAEKLAAAGLLRSSGDTPAQREAALRKLAQEMEDRAWKRDGESTDECDGNCDNSDCHTVSAVATWMFAARMVEKQADALRPVSSPADDTEEADRG